MRINTEFESSGLVFFIMVLEIFNNESVHSTFKYELGGFNTWELLPDITDYK